MKLLMRCLLLVLLLSSTVFSSDGIINPEIDSCYEKAVITARKEIWKRINSGGAGSGSVAIMENGELVYFEGFAMADREKSIRVDEETVFNIASVSKVFAAAAIMLLVDEGKIELDEPVNRYLTEFKSPDPRYREITVRMLLNHTSGLAGSTLANTFGYEYNQDANKVIMENINNSNLIHDPGSVAVYCNDGFALAEMIVERVSGTNYIDFLGKGIFEPLNMDKTGMTSEAFEKGVPAAFYSTSTGEKEPLEVISSLSAGGLNSTVVDLCKFADSFSDAGNRLFSKSSLDELKKQQPGYLDYQLKNPPMSYGLGWDYTSMPEYEQEGIQVIGKSGSSMNFGSMILTIPKLRLSVAVIETGTNPDSPVIAEKVLKQVLIGKGILKEKPIQATVPLKAQSLPNEYKSYEGYYVGSSGSLNQVQIDEESRMISIKNFNEGQMVQAASFFYNNGYLYDDSEGGNKSYLHSFDDLNYYVFLSFGMDFLYMEKLEELTDTKRLMMDINGKLWLRRNVQPREHQHLQYNHIQKSYTLDELPGYCYFNGIQRITSLTSADFVAKTARDQKNLALINSDGVVWAQTSDMIYSPASDITPLKKDSESIIIGVLGYNEWLMIDENAIITFAIPETGRVVVFSPEGSPIYDSMQEFPEVYVEQGSYIELIGYPGDTFNLKSRLK